MVDELVTRK